MKNYTLSIIIIGSIAVLCGGLIAYQQTQSKDSTTTSVDQTTQSDSAETPAATSQASEANRTSDDVQTSTQQLLYLIEEEKLAHDVYTAMYELYGARVFGNILDSESTHQSRVLSLLNERGIDDPRSNELGVFTDQSLQQLYDDLIAKGQRSEQDAFEVGVIIEEKDIADITTQLATTSDDDILNTLEALRKGSENHLRAFNKQL